MSTDKRTIDWYNQNAQKYTEHVRDPDDSKYHSLYEKPAMFKQLPELKGLNVISLGCGPGEDTNALKKLGASRAVGVDISEELIKIAQESYDDCEFFVMDMAKLDFDDEEFDFAYSSLAMSYIKDWTNLLKGVARILKPRSRFIFSCEHPIFTAMERKQISETASKWTLAVERDKQAATVKIQGDWLNQHPSPNGISPEVTTWHRSYSKISGDILNSGFKINQIIEPLPQPRMKELRPSTYKSLTIIPEFLIMELHKEA